MYYILWYNKNSFLYVAYTTLIWFTDNNNKTQTFPVYTDFKNLLGF